jgi:hypothetical protein
MAETLLVRAKDSFVRIKTKLSHAATSQSVSEIIFEPDIRRIKLRLDADPTNPGLILIQEGKPNLAPAPGSGETVEVEKIQRRFDAFGTENSFGWVDHTDLESARGDDEIVAIVLGLL